MYQVLNNDDVFNVYRISDLFAFKSLYSALYRDIIIFSSNDKGTDHRF